MLTLLRYLLFPFSWLFHLIVNIRNYGYQKGIFKSKAYDFPIILVGNVLVGGTGKTPMVSYLLKLLRVQYRLASLSRGYGRKTKGFLLANAYSTAAEIGDEPLQLFQNFGQSIYVAVCENRNTGIQKLIPKVDAIVMDDAFQHRKVSAGLQIVLFPYDCFYKSQWLLPAGSLREPWLSHRRADVIVVSKCPFNLSTKDKNFILKKLKISTHQKVFFTSIQYQNLIKLSHPSTLPLEALQQKNILLITGIVQTQPILNTLQQYSQSIKHMAFKDHHNFSLKDVKDIVNTYKQLSEENTVIITTEKDAQRLKSTEIENLLRNLPFYYFPIEIQFLENSGMEFDNLINNYVETYSRNRSVYSTKNAGI